MKLHSIFKITAFVAAVLTLSACSDELMVQNGVPGNGDSFWSQYDFVISDDAETRVSYTDTKHSEFEEGDEVGVYVVDGDGNLESGQPTNVRYTVRSVTNIKDGVQRQVLQPANPELAVKKDPSYRYVLYYPYNPNMTLDRLKNYTHTVESNQNSHDAFEKSDLLWCYFTPPSSEDAVYEVEFDHVMAQIIVEVGEDATNVELLNMPLTAYGINLVQPLTDGFGYNAAVPPYPATEENTPITAYYFGYADSGNKIFRAVVPAHTFDKDGAGVPAVRITSGGEAKNYKISPREGGFTFKPGYIYTLTLNKGTGTTDIEVTEDDSWVLDVLDPETGEPVGLLCREYLLYAPDGKDFVHTGDETPDGKSKYVNSQAWVFYNLRSDGTPNLETGTVLRFTYDVQINTNGTGIDFNANAFGATTAYTPHPDKNIDAQGVFLPQHGFYWTTTYPGQDAYLDDGGGTELRVEGATDKRLNEQNYHMHGGTVVWDIKNADGYKHSYIKEFKLPSEGQYESSQMLNDENIGDGSGFITNRQAKEFGHIAIRPDGTVGVSYRPISADNKNVDIDKNKVGLLQPHYLIDRRISKDGSIDEQKYPLVKIGHNQFWMSTSLRARTFTDGNTITCYNARGNDKPADVTFEKGTAESIGAGCLYPFSQSIKDGEGKPYDPVNDDKEMHPGPSTLYPDMDFRVAPFYNKAAVEDDRFVPVSNDSRFYYQMPTISTMRDMMGYFASIFPAKISSDKYMLRTSHGVFAETYEGVSSDYYSALYGLAKNVNAPQNYCANVGGFNLKPRGYYQPGSSTGFADISKDAVIILKSEVEGQEGVDYFVSHLYDPFNTLSFEVGNESSGQFLLVRNGYESIPAYINKFFGQVRMVMKFRNQLDNGGTASYSATSTSTRAGNKAAGSRSVMLHLVP